MMKMRLDAGCVKVMAVCRFLVIYIDRASNVEQCRRQNFARGYERSGVTIERLWHPGHVDVFSIFFPLLVGSGGITPAGEKI